MQLKRPASPSGSRLGVLETWVLVSRCLGAQFSVSWSQSWRSESRSWDPRVLIWCWSWSFISCTTVRATLLLRKYSTKNEPLINTDRWTTLHVNLWPSQTGLIYQIHTLGLMWHTATYTSCCIRCQIGSSLKCSPLAKSLVKNIFRNSGLLMRLYEWVIRCFHVGLLHSNN